MEHSIYAKSRFYDLEKYDIHISEEEIKAAGRAKAAASGIPSTHNRKIYATTIEGELEAVLSNRTVTDEEYKVGEEIAYRPANNLGTKQWADVYYPVRIGKITKVSPKTVEVDWGRISREYILGRMVRE